jgi:hypothetical protein
MSPPPVIGNEFVVMSSIVNVLMGRLGGNDEYAPHTSFFGLVGVALKSIPLIDVGGRTIKSLPLMDVGGRTIKSLPLDWGGWWG